MATQLLSKTTLKTGMVKIVLWTSHQTTLHINTSESRKCTLTIWIKFWPVNSIWIWPTTKPSMLVPHWMPLRPHDYPNEQRGAALMAPQNGCQQTPRDKKMTPNSHTTKYVVNLMSQLNLLYDQQIFQSHSRESSTLNSTRPLSGEAAWLVSNTA